MAKTSSRSALRAAVSKAKSGRKIGMTDEALLIAEKVDAAIIELRKEAEAARPRKYGVYHPSELGSMYPCDRRVFYSYLGTEKDNQPSAKLQRIFDNGHDVHTRLQRYLHKAFGDRFKDEVSMQIEVDDGSLVYGHADGTLELDSGELVVVEIKSAATHTCSKLSSPPSYHTAQATCYGKAAGIERILFVYENKNTQDLIFIFQVIDEKAWKRALSIIREVEKHLVGGTLPNTSEGPWCNDCSFKNLCERETLEDEDKEF